MTEFVKFLGLSMAPTADGEWRVAIPFWLFIAPIVVGWYLWLGYPNLQMLAITWRQSVLAICLAVFLSFGIRSATLLVFGSDQVKQFNNERDTVLADTGVARRVFGGAFEEVLFRGCLQAVSVPYVGLWPSLVVTNTLFGALHISGQASVFTNSVMAVLAAFLGICLGLVFYYTGSLTAVMLMHGIINLVATAFRHFGW